MNGSLHRPQSLFQAVARFWRGMMIVALTFLIRCYQALVRPLLSGSCKFFPSCSEYAIEALHTHGVARGLRLSAGRLARCHPFGRGGFDPVEPTANPRASEDGV